ncbi:XRE family transcriptional regulator [Variovorax sp. J22P271]|uniref:helix-turn-helix domain-containing protein n=1 Tax=Variovorax davisae TaxID=3053515 RepID=UPI00257668D8|nr:XRE family transcriptional regulator [Variovorax sp. J22P271]MDM0031774.1 XRE family transcriptional regulator [Variovorax sp. J22P271]
MAQRKNTPKAPTAQPAARAGTERSTGALDDERIGEDIRGLRKARRMTLADLSRRIGRSVAYLSKLERNLTKPSVAELQALGEALGVKINFFFHETNAASHRKMVVRKADRRKLSYADGVTDHLLSPSLEGELELLMSVFEPGSGSGETSYFHEGEEAGVVLAGALEFWVGDEHFVCEEGDSFSFKSSVPHRYRNNGAVQTVVIWVVTPPSY